MIDLKSVNELFFLKRKNEAYNLLLDDLSTFNNENCIKKLNLKLNKFPMINYSLLENEFFIEDKKIKEIVYEKFYLHGFKLIGLELFGEKIKLLKNGDSYILVINYSRKEDEEEINNDYLLRRYIPGLMCILHKFKPKEFNILYKHRFKKTEKIYTLINNEINKEFLIQYAGTSVTYEETRKIYEQVENVINQIKMNRKITNIKNKKRCTKCYWKDICNSI